MTIIHMGECNCDEPNFERVFKSQNSFPFPLREKIIVNVEKKQIATGASTQQILYPLWFWHILSITSNYKTF